MHNMYQRALTALIVVPVSLWIVARGGLLYNLSLFVLCMLSLYELRRLVSVMSSPWFLWGALYIIGAVFCLAALCCMALPSVLGDNFPLLVGFLTMIWISDSLAYIGGRLVGRYPLMPRISPGKTWEGLIIALIGGVCYALGFLYWQAPSFAQAPMATQLLIGVMILGLLVVGHAGDGLESLLKRRFSVKDSGGMFPGHGGVLDRMDSTFSSAVMLVAMLFVHKVLWGM